MHEPPSISLILPSYQQARYIEATLRSVIEQQYPNLELLVYDGGSTDGSVEIIRRYEKHIAWWQSQSDGGQVAAINAGLQRATGEVVGWLNSDDILLPGSLAAIGCAFGQPDVQMTCGWSILFDDTGCDVQYAVYPQPTARIMLQRPVLPQESVYWRRSLIDRVGLIDDSFSLRFDVEYWTRLAQRGVIPRLLPRFIGGFRQHGAQKTQVLQEKLDGEAMRIYRKIHGESADAAQLRRAIPWLWKRRRAWLRWQFRHGWRKAPPLPDYTLAERPG